MTAAPNVDQQQCQNQQASATPRVPGRNRAIIEAVRPCIDGGRFPIKRVIGEPVHVEADVIADGHDHLGCILRYRACDQPDWSEQRMREQANDLWIASFTPTDARPWEYRVLAWVDPFETWRHDLRKKVEAGQDIRIDLQVGAEMIRRAAEHGDRHDADFLSDCASRLLGSEPPADRARLGWSERVAKMMWRVAPREHVEESPVLRVSVERRKALFSTWYELFPRSATDVPGRHGTFRDVEERIPYIAEAGFDILYLPPIHPIGRTNRKGPNNAPDAGAEDPGSPWAIGGPEGGHKSIHPDLGSLEDLDNLVAAAERHGMELALDLAFQCTPDHPYVTEHPDWFRHRPDGTIQYAENPPKKYQDIYPFDFECRDWRSLWEELKQVTLFWIDHGIRIFRVDNPHTKPFRFWEWLIAEVRRDHSDTLFLSEAFTKPKKMYRLAKGGFSQSYTYFAWRNDPAELQRYVEELCTPPICDLFRPNFWPNTPDILTAYLQEGGRPAAMARLVLAATLSSSYGIYGPVFELCDFAPRAPGAEENLDSEKYQLRHWNLEDPWSLMPFIGYINRIRRENPALQQFRDIVFHHCDNPAHIAYSKRSQVAEPSASQLENDASIDRNVVLCVVNTDPHNTQWGTVRLDLAPLGVAPGSAFELTDLLGGGRFQWHGADNVVGLPAGQSHIFRVERAGRTERDFATWA